LGTVWHTIPTGKTTLYNLLPCCPAPLQRATSLQRTASRKEMGEVAVNAAESAYDLIADLEEEQQLRTQGLSASGSTETMYFASGGWVGGGQGLGGMWVP